MGWFISSSSRVQRLNETKVRTIRQAFARGYTQAQIAKTYDIPASTVNDIVLRKTWKNV